MNISFLPCFSFLFFFWSTYLKSICLLTILLILTNGNTLPTVTQTYSHINNRHIHRPTHCHSVSHSHSFALTCVIVLLCKMAGAVKMESSEVGREKCLNGLWIAKVLNKHCNMGLQAATKYAKNWIWHYWHLVLTSQMRNLQKYKIII